MKLPINMKEFRKHVCNLRKKKAPVKITTKPTLTPKNCLAKSKSLGKPPERRKIGKTEVAKELRKKVGGAVIVCVKSLPPLCLIICLKSFQK